MVLTLEKLQHLVSQSIQDLNAILNNSTISAQERTQLALEKLEAVGMTEEVLKTILDNEQIAIEERTALVYKLMETTGVSPDSLETLLEKEQISAQEKTTLGINLLQQANLPTPLVVQTPTLSTPTNSQSLLTFLPFSPLTQPQTHQLPQFQPFFSQNKEEQNQKGLPRTWKEWIAENKLLGRTDSSILQTMIAGGIDEQTAQQAIKDVTAESSFQAGSRVLQLSKKLESILKINQELAKLSPKFGTIERKSRLSREEFLENYYSKNTPVILTEMMNDWQAMSLWSPEYLKTKYGEVQVEIQFNRNSDPQYELNKHQHRRTIKLAEYVDMVLAGKETNDYYLVANNGALDREELKSLLNDINMFPEFLNGAETSGKVFFWFGPAGTITPLHHDPANLFMAHVTGRKRWRIISPSQTPLLYNYVGVFSKVDCENPDYEKYPLFRNVDIIEAVLEPGEVIFIPVGWWHQVKALDISLSVSFTNFVFANIYNYEDPNLPNW